MVKLDTREASDRMTKMFEVLGCADCSIRAGAGNQTHTAVTKREKREGRSLGLSAKERSLAYCATGAPYSAIVSNRACAKPFRRGSLKNHHEHTNTSAPDARRAEAFRLLCAAMLVRGEAF